MGSDTNVSKYLQQHLFYLGFLLKEYNQINNGKINTNITACVDKIYFYGLED